MGTTGPRFYLADVTVKKHRCYRIVDRHGVMVFAPVRWADYRYPSCNKLYQQVHDLNMKYDPVYRAQARNEP